MLPLPLQDYVYAAHAKIIAPDGTIADARLRYNTKTLSKTINIDLPGVGAICRLDVDGTIHKNVGRNHKHEFQSIKCLKRNLPTARSRDDLAGKDMQEVFDHFCHEANIINPGKIL